MALREHVADFNGVLTEPLVYTYVETPALRSEISAAQERTYSLVQVVYDVGMRTTSDIQGLELVTMVRRPAEKEHQLASHISVVMKVVAKAGENSSKK